MCGLSGYTGTTKCNPYALRVLLMDNEVRGRHATGIANSSGEIFKKAVILTSFMMYYRFNKVADSNLVIVHNRWSTMSNATDDDAAHPFSFDDGRIIGAHNGFLYEWEKQAELFGIDKSTITVDSELFYHHLKNNNYDVSCLSDIEGAAALSWIDTKKKMLFLYRRTSRPLFIAEMNKGEIYYSSREEGLLQLAPRGIVELEPNIVYGFKNGVLVSMTPVAEPMLKLPLDCFTSQVNRHVTQELRDKLGIEYEPTKYTYTPPKTWGNVSGLWGHSYGEEWENTLFTQNKMRSQKEKKISVAKVLGGKLEDLVSLGIDNFDKVYSDNLDHKEVRRKFTTKEGATFVLRVDSSIDNKPVGDAIVFIDSMSGSSKFLTTEKGIASIPVPPPRIGTFMRIGIIPFPYNRMYYTKLLHLESGEIMEVSLSIPFLASDRSEIKSWKVKQGDKLQYTIPELQSKSSGVLGNADKAAINDEYGKGDNSNSDGKLQSELGEPNWFDELEGGTWKIDDEEDEQVENVVNQEDDDGSEPSFDGVGEVETYGYLSADVGADNTTIFGYNYIAVVDIDTDTYRRYVYEWNKICELNVSLISKYTDTSWAYLRFCGRHPYDLVKRCERVISASDYLKIEDILLEAKKLI